VRFDLAGLRAYAATRTLFPPTDLAGAVRALGFVQIDPIRAPARAQDLVLRLRVAGYRIGDLDRRFSELPLVEDSVHVYGALPEASLAFLHPRARLRRWRVEQEHPALARKIVDHVGRNGPTHPRDLTRALGAIRIVNGWGGISAATTRMLEVLHYRGVLRVVRREQGVRIYDVALPRAIAMPPATRSRELLQMLVKLYAPLPKASLRQLAAMLPVDMVAEDLRMRTFERLTRSKWLARAVVDGVEYVWPADENVDAEAPDVVRLLAPFDPIVWDRRRFAHLWGWDYRFEAYTPSAKRRFGYYAMPLLWRDGVIGWANVTMRRGKWAVDTGFVGKPPRPAAFARGLEREIDALRRSLASDETAPRGNAANASASAVSEASHE
jgi:uncharacterized protein YcaQ